MGAGMFSEIVDTASQCREKWKKTASFLRRIRGPNDECFALDENFAGYGFDFKGLNTKALSTFKLVISLKSVRESRGILIPDPYIEELREAIDEAHKGLSHWSTFIDNINQSGVASIDAENWTISSNDENSMDVEEIITSIDEVLAKYYVIAPITRIPKLEIFAESVKEASECVADAKAHADNASKAKDRAKSSATKTEEHLERAKGVADDISSAGESASEMVSNAENTLKEVESNRQKIEQVVLVSDSLSGKLDSCKAHADGFEDFIAENKASIGEWNNKALQNDETIKKQLKEIKDSIKQSDAMLKGATNAGLSVVFKDARIEFDKELVIARRSFYRSIALLISASMPLIFNFLVFSLPFSGAKEQTREDIPGGFFSNVFSIFGGGDFNFGVTIALFLLTVPFIWLTKFSESRYHQLFQLREHYKYKYSLAMSVDGFKKQSPEYENEIAAETFNHLLFNPADRIKSKKNSEGHPNKVVDAIINRIRPDENE